MPQISMSVNIIIKEKSHQFEIQGLRECLEGRDLGEKEEAEEGNYIIIF